MSSVVRPGPASRRIQALFGTLGNADYIGEPVSIIEHSLQAASLADSALGDDEVTIAALLHDIGHVVGMEAGMELAMEGCGIADHEGIGARFVALLGLSERVQRMVQNHISAKRYLCQVKPEYYTSLSDASKTTLRYQGGVMTAEEARAYEADPDHTIYIRMRSWDEQAKIPGKIVPPLESYYERIDRYSSLGKDRPGPVPYLLSECQLQFWRDNGFIKVRNMLGYYEQSPADVGHWVSEISNWEKVENKWLLHWELVEAPDGGEGTRTLCRAENFTPYHEAVRNLCDTQIRSVVSQLFGEEAKLFKEKINFKLPGGSGFSCHQDSPAYIGMAENHVSVMVAVDAATKENGCLQVAPGRWVKGQVPLDEKGVVTPEAEGAMAFQHIECVSGDILFFSGYLPHRSDANCGDKARRAMFITYNPGSEGDHHEDYYKAKHAGLQGFSTTSTISFQGDFQGKIVD